MLEGCPVPSTRLTRLLAVPLLVAACAAHEGAYAPDCIAFAGDTITLEEGRFTWDKFTDEVRVDESGRRLDPHPEYPVAGRYRKEGERLVLEADDGRALPDMYLRHVGQRWLLLTAEQHQALEATGTRPDCPLILGAPPEDPAR